MTRPKYNNKKGNNNNSYKSHREGNIENNQLKHNSSFVNYQQMMNQSQMNAVHNTFSNSKKHHYNTSSNLLPENPTEQLIDDQNRFKKNMIDNKVIKKCNFEPVD
jgi:hypothetical protein